MVSQFASQFCKKHGPQDRSATDRIARLLRASITPRRPRGRPASREVRQAAEMRRKGTEWRTIYVAVLPGFATMDKYERTWRTSSLRRNVKGYLKRHGFRCGKDRLGDNVGRCG